MVGVAQLVECKIVILVVVGSIPIVHPIFLAPARERVPTIFEWALLVKIPVNPLLANIIDSLCAKVAELVDAPDLGSGILDVRVRVSPFAPF